MAKRASEGKATEKDKNKMNTFVKQYVSSIIRTGLAGVSGYFATQGLPQLSDTTQANLSDLAVSAALLIATLGWSWVEKYFAAKKK